MTRKTEQMNRKKRSIGRPIICGTDFSGVATEAVEIAAAMARRFETRLVLVHVDQCPVVLIRPGKRPANRKQRGPTVLRLKHGANATAE